MILSYFVLKIETLLMYIDNFQDQISFPGFNGVRGAQSLVFV